MLTTYRNYSRQEWKKAYRAARLGRGYGPVYYVLYERALHAIASRRIVLTMEAGGAVESVTIPVYETFRNVARFAFEQGIPYREVQTSKLEA